MTVEYRHIVSPGLWQMETCSDAHCREMSAVWECTAATVVGQFDYELIIHSHVIIDNPHTISELHTATQELCMYTIGHLSDGPDGIEYNR